MDQEETESKLNKFKNKLVLVFHSEDGNEITQKGVITDIDSNFIYLESRLNLYAIAIKEVIKIKLSYREGQR